jgi:hypothetical protein
MGYYFVVHVSEGEKGFRSEDTYTSSMYNSIEECTKDIRAFNPNVWWKDLRSIKYMRIYSSGTGKYINFDG